MKILAAQLNFTIGDLEGNTQKILAALQRAKRNGVDVVLFSELAITGYCPEDLLFSSSLLEKAAKQLDVIRSETQGLFVVVGVPRKNGIHQEKPLYNSAAVFSNGQLLGYKDKTLLPTYDVFDERRFFEPGKEEPVWEFLGHRIGITICEDIWRYSLAPSAFYEEDPVLVLKDKKVDLILNLSASPYCSSHKQNRLLAFQKVAKELSSPLIFCNQVGANDQLIFDGHSLYVNEKGELIQMAKGFVEDDLMVDLNTHACPCIFSENKIKDLYSALVLGARDYFHKQGFKKAILGLSGGIDSSVVACVAKEALGAENVLGVALPSRYSSKQSLSDAVLLCENLKIELQEICIDSIFQNYLDLLSSVVNGSLSSLSQENLQPRIRTAILMAIANEKGLILLNTSNKSEMAMGYATLYGDMAGGLGVLQDVKKSHVYQLAAFINARQEVIPKAIIDKEPSAELRENQTDLDTLPSYEILDAVIEDYIEAALPVEEIAEKRALSAPFLTDLIHKIHLAEYKRRQAPIGLRVTQKAFGKGRLMPIVQKWK